MPFAALDSQMAPTARVEPSADSATVEPNSSSLPVLDALMYANRLTVQSFWQPSKLTVLLSSHISPAVTTPLPQAVMVQLLSQPSPSMGLPSSHSSIPRWTLPSPHVLNLQVDRQSSVSSRLPSSHCSPTSRMPLPQPSVTTHIV